MQCPNCNKANEDGALFCGNCGKQLSPLYGGGNAATELSHSPPTPSDNSFWSTPSNRSFQGPPLAFPGSAQPNLPSGFPISTQPDPPLAFSPTNVQTYEQAMPGAPTIAPRPGQSPGEIGTVYQSGPNSFYDGSATSVTPGPLSRPPHPPTHSRNKGLAFLSIVVVICVVGVLAGVITILQSGAGSTGTTSNKVGTKKKTQITVLFSDNGGDTNSIEVDASGLTPPTTGTRYVVWLVNEGDTENIQSLGTLSVPDRPDAIAGQMTLKTTKHGMNLLGVGNEILITRETGNVNQPTASNTLFSATFPPQAFVHIRHLLVQFDTTPNHVGLLVGLRQQATLLNQQAQNLKNNQHDQQIVQCSLYNMLSLIEGSEAVKNIQKPKQCDTVGDGFGLLGPQDGRGNEGYNAQSYVGLADAHAQLAATRKDATKTIQLHAGHVENAMDDLGTWLGTLETDVQSLLNNANASKKIAEVARLAGIALHGTDANDDGTIEPIKGEAGAETAYQHGQLMATLSLTPGSGTQK